MGKSSLNSKRKRRSSIRLLPLLDERKMEDGRMERKRKEWRKDG